MFEEVFANLQKSLKALIKPVCIFSDNFVTLLDIIYIILYHF